MYLTQTRIAIVSFSLSFASEREDIVLKLKQILKTPIILLILGSICLISLTYLGINLLNRFITTARQEREAMQNIRALMRTQGAYYLEWQNFSDSIEELQIKIAPGSENYRYRIYTAIQTTLNDYLFLNLDKKTIELIITKDWTRKKAPKLPTISSDIVMMTAHPRKAGLKTYIAFVFSCSKGYQMGTPDCPDDGLTSGMFYESEQPLNLPPNRLRLEVDLPFPPCDRTGCIGEQIPTPEGFHPYKNNN